MDRFTRPPDTVAHQENATCSSVGSKRASDAENDEQFALCCEMSAVMHTCTSGLGGGHEKQLTSS